MVLNVVYTCVLYKTKNGTRRVFYRNSQRIPKERVPTKVYKKLKCYVIRQEGTQGIRRAEVNVHVEEIKHDVEPSNSSVAQVEPNELLALETNVVQTNDRESSPLYEDISPVFQIDHNRNIFKQLTLMNLPKSLRRGFFSNSVNKVTTDVTVAPDQTLSAICAVTKQQMLDFFDFIREKTEDDEHVRINKFAPGDVTNSEVGSAAGVADHYVKRGMVIKNPSGLTTTCAQIIRQLPQKCLFNKWRIVSVLGRGAYGFVFLVQGEIRGDVQLAAMKVQVENPGVDFTTTTMEIDMQRAFSAEKLSPQILCVDTVRIHGYNVTVILMERIDFTLRDYLMQKRLHTNDLKLVMSLVLKLMLRLHNLGFTHGDMHDENIGFKVERETGQIRIVLIDLGMATTNKNYAVVDAEQLLRSIIISKYPRKIREYFQFNLQWFLYNVVHSRYKITGSTKQFNKVHTKYIKAEFLSYNRSYANAASNE